MCRNRCGQIALLSLTLMRAASGQPQTATITAISSTLNSEVSHVNNRVFAFCQLRAAIWGSYNARVSMPRASTTGNQALIFSINGGIFTQEPDPSPSNSSAATVIRDGTVALNSREEAFARRLTFFIDNVSFDNPTTIRYTVHSNPAISVPIANILYESVSSTGSQQIADTPNPFASSAQPRTSTFTLNAPLNPTGEYYLSAVLGSAQICLGSNEVELLSRTTTNPWLRHRLPVLQAFNNGGRISSGTWLQIFGDRLSTTTRSWAGGDFQGAQAPTSLDGVRVNINGRPAAVSYVSPNQVNAQVPDDETSGNVEVEVINARGASNKRTIEKAPASPALLTPPAFLVNGKQYLAALFTDFVMFAGRAGLISGVPFRAPKPGETIVVYAVGCGRTTPPSPAEQVVAAPAPLASAFEFRIGGIVASAQGFLAAQALGL